MKNEVQKAIWKYPLTITDSQLVVAPRGAKFLSVINQKGTLVLYAIVLPGPPFEDYRVEIRGTGHPVSIEVQQDYAFLGTVEYELGLVWHIFVERRCLEEHS